MLDYGIAGGNGFLYKNVTHYLMPGRFTIPLIIKTMECFIHVEENKA